MLIEIERLNERGTDFEHTYTPADFSLEDEHARVASAVRVTARATRTRGEVRVAGTIDTAVETACDRCLAPLAVPVNVSFKADLGLAGDAGGANELQDADMDFSTYEGDAIDLDEIVREQILLALPARQLCAEDCKGLCPTCGANLNEKSCDCEQRKTDVRWSALEELKNREP
ncbi:MAG: DUF177 domain-containing protein [Acidobacteria bacterium]|nr:DUF177 domain-containing protein [Acidobacteriota bacterium]